MMMNARRLKTTIVGLFMLTVMIFISSKTADEIQEAGARIAQPQGMRVRSKNLNVLTKNSDFEAVQPYKCVILEPLYKDYRPQMCLKNETDHLSRTIMETGAWEPHILRSVMMAVEAYPDATFVDIGANIGMFTMAIVAMNRKAITVDAVLRNHGYIRESLAKAGATDKAVLVYNGVSDEYETLYPYLEWDLNAFLDNNDAAIRLVHEKEIKDKKYVVGSPMHTVKLIDIMSLVKTKTAILKLDIEGYECKALEDFEEVFKTTDIYVPYMFMEWIHMKGDIGQCRNNYISLVRQFYRAGYYPAESDTFKPKTEPFMGTWEVVWVHRTAIDLSLGYD